MNIEAKIEKLEKQAQKPGINTWAHLMAYNGPWPAIISPEMKGLFENTKMEG